MRCGGCGEVIQINNTICQCCGHRQKHVYEWQCPNCGKINSPERETCWNCGKP